MSIFNPRLLRIAMAFALLGVSAATTAQALPEAVSRNGVLYMTGGIGEDEAKTFRSLAPRYSLRMTFTAAAGNYLSDVDVTIADASGRTVLDTLTGGPSQFVMLPAGRYRVVPHAGNTKVTRVGEIWRRGGVELRIVLLERATGDAQANCPHCRAPTWRQGEPRS
jgi:hypothetical protein